MVNLFSAERIGSLNINFHQPFNSFIMKKIKIMLLILTLGLSNVLLAGGIETKPGTSNTLSEEISRFMKQHFIPLEEDLRVEVKFRINEYREIVVLSVDCGKPEVREFISLALNNKTPKTNSYEIGKLYILPVRLKS